MFEAEIALYLRAIDKGVDLSAREGLALLLDGITWKYSGYDIADKLLEIYPSLTDIVKAPFRELRDIECLGLEGARLIKSSSALSTILLRENCTDDYPLIFSRDDATNFLRPIFLGQENEMCYVCLLNERYRLIHHQQVALGDRWCTPLNIKYIVRLLAIHNASHVLVAHNHFVTHHPSDDDIKYTQKLDTLLNELDYKLSDHIIFFENHAISMREEGYIREISLDSLMNRRMTGKDF